MKSLYACAAVVSIVIACRNNGIQQTGPLTTSQGTDDADSGPVTQISVRGAVQKGPFILGTTVDVSPLDADANPIGLSFSTTTQNDLGEFIVANLPPGPVFVEASGFHFNEVLGKLSGARLTLRAVDAAEEPLENLNLNVLTHMIEPRTRFLVAENDLEMSVALGQAQAELLAGLAFGAPTAVVDTPFSGLSIIGDDTDGNAYLLTLGATLAWYARSQGEEQLDATLQQTINAIASDLQPDGLLGPETSALLDEWQAKLPEQSVREYLSARLTELGLPTALPDIDRILDDDHDGIANYDEDEDFDGVRDLVDNCVGIANPDQTDNDNDGKGNACDLCIDTVPDDDSDADGDGFGNGCDICRYNPDKVSPGDGTCCDPRDGACAPKDSSYYYYCVPPSFSCRAAGIGLGSSDFAEPCYSNTGCVNGLICAAKGAVGPKFSCDPMHDRCCTNFCTVGLGCNFEGGECLPWYEDGTSPEGLEDLGICVRVEDGPCAGQEFARKCVYGL